MGIEFDEINKEIMALLEDGPKNPSKAIRDKYSLSKQAVTKRLKKLVDEGVLITLGRGSGTKYLLVPPGSKTETFTEEIGIRDIIELGEDRIYSQRISPEFTGLNQNSETILNHIFTEMLNNVMDHSKGTKALVTIAQNESDIEAVISDDGIGVFQSIKVGFGLDSLYQSITELLKGKRTTDQDNHAGEGLFFSLRLADKFIIDANGLSLMFWGSKDDYTFGPSRRPDESLGTSITFQLQKQSERVAGDVFRKFTDEAFQFVNNRPFVVQPYTIEPEGPMVSRSEAKRFIAGAEDSSSIIVNFKNVDSIGQGFADEIFRVWANRHPHVKIYFQSGEFVEMMIKRVGPPKNVMKLELQETNA